MLLSEYRHLLFRSRIRVVEKTHLIYFRAFPVANEDIHSGIECFQGDINAQVYYEMS